MCNGKFCLHKKTFQSLNRRDYQCPQCSSICQVRNVSFEEQTNSFFLMCIQRIYIFEETQKSIGDIIGDVYCPGRYCSILKCVYVHTCEEDSDNCYECVQCRACCHVLNILFKNQKPTIMLYGGDGAYCFAKKMRRDYEAEKPCH